jgi:Bacterial membrane protein YfhO
LSPTTLLPALWVAFLAGLLALVLRRWWDPVPARCWAAWGAVIALLFGEALATGQVLLPLGYLVRLPPYRLIGESLGGPPPGNLLQGDLVLQIAPWLELVRGALGDGRWPLWNHLAGAGEPLLGNPQSQALQPLAWLALLFPVAAAVGVLAALRVLLALVFTFLFLRRQEIGETPALAGSLAFGLGGYLLGWVGWPLGGSAAFLPLLLYALTMADQRGARRDHLLLGLGVAGLLLVGHPETALYALLFAAAFALVRLAAAGPGERGRRIAAWGMAGLVGIGLAAPVLLPASSVLPQSRRAELLEARRQRLAAGVGEVRVESEDGADEAKGDDQPGASRPVRRLIPLAAPNAFGNNRFGRYWGERNVLNDSAGWTGTAALLAALLALAPPGRGRRFPQERLALATALLCLVVLARPPGLDRLLSGVPVLGQSASHHSRVSLLFTFCTAWLAACAWERWRRGELRRVALVPAALVLGGMISWGYLAHPNPRDPAALSGLRRGSLVLHLASLGMAALLLAVRRPEGEIRPDDHGRDRGLSDRSFVPAWAAAGLVLLAAAEPLAIRLPSNPATPARLFYPENAPLRFLRERLGASPPGTRIAGLGPALRPNFATMHGLADARSSNPARPAAVLEAISRVNGRANQATDVFTAPDDPLYDLLGVRYLITAPRQRLPAPLRPVLKRKAAWIWERPRPLPRLFLPAAAGSCLAPTWAVCNAGIGDFAAQAVLRPTRQMDLPAAWAAADPAAASLVLNALEPARIRATARLAERRLLASSVYQDGGWALLAGGADGHGFRKIPTTLANGPFVAAWLPAPSASVPSSGGGSLRPIELELIYRPPGFLAGLLLAALALAAGFAAWTPPPTVSRR